MAGRPATPRLEATYQEASPRAIARVTQLLLIAHQRRIAATADTRECGPVEDSNPVEAKAAA